MPRDRWAEARNKDVSKRGKSRMSWQPSNQPVGNKPMTKLRSYKVRRHDLALKLLSENPKLTMAEAERQAGLMLGGYKPTG